MALTKKEKEYLEILRKNLGVVAFACKSSNVSRAWHYQHIHKNPDFKKAVEEVEEDTIDYAETALYKKIKEGDTTATIFFLKTKGKKRGYVERVENEVTVNPFMELMKQAGEE